jgi:lipid-A-disaccharide synthase
MSKKIMIIAGEASGDLHGSLLIKELKKLNSETEFFGIGGKFMKKEGFNAIYDLSSEAIVGFWEVLKKIFFFKKIFKGCVKLIKKENPVAIILIDFPGFNLRFAKEAKKLNKKVIYYISPQVWAWGKGRIKLIKRYIDKMIVFFKFEEELYKKYGMDVEFVGHPLLEIVKPTDVKENLIEKFEIPSYKKTIALLPGSRTGEIKKHLPILINVAEILDEKGDYQFLLSQTKNISEEIYKQYLNKTNFSIKIIKDNPYDCIEVSDFVLVSSGTATLETAILEKPMIIIYKTSFLNWLLIKPQIKIPYIGLVNVVAEKKIAPEFVQFNAKAKNIAEEVLRIINDRVKIDEIKLNLKQVKEKLGEIGAARRAAKIILDFLN